MPTHRHWHRLSLLARALALMLGLASLLAHAAPANFKPKPKPKPNIIFILADDLGYGDLGCYGQKFIQTPNIDKMAKEGMRFPQFYAGCTVCAPSRSVLMTGLHTGHTRVRGNAGQTNPRAQSLRPEDVTVAKVLKSVGYTTGLIGKWGLGDEDGGEEGLPRRQGFDYFFGYLNQLHAHNYFPAYLIRNESHVLLENVVPGEGRFGQGYATKKIQYSHDLMAADALKWLDENKANPFLLFLTFTTPHANNEATRALGNGQEVPDYGIYKDKDWPDPNKGQAAMITRLDADVGRVFAFLKANQLDENTLVFFSSDNGPHKEGGNDPEFFRAHGELTGIKRSLTDGGIRVPFIARWPGRIRAGAESTHVGFFGDILATLADLTGAKPPEQQDGLSLLPTLLGKLKEQQTHEFLYWEFHEKGFNQAALWQGRWKGIRLGRHDAPLELFDLQNDLAETKNVAAQHPDIAEKLVNFLDHARTDSPDWPIKDATATKAAEKKRAE